MIGMILCGGYGTRLQRFEPNLPKVLLDIQNSLTILDKQLFNYKSAGFDQVILLTGYLSKKIEERYGPEYKGLKIGYIVENRPLGTLNAVRLGMQKENQDAMVSNGDVVTDLNLKSMKREFERSNCLGSIFVTKMPSPYGMVILGDKFIESFEEKPRLDHYINGGFYCFSKDILELLNEFVTGDLEKKLFPKLAKEKQLAHYREDVPFWASIDTARDLEKTRQEFEGRIEKPWGFEKVLNLTDAGVTKNLYILGGYRTSLHIHERREETLHVRSGSGHIEFENRDPEKFKEGSVIKIKPKTLHSIVATKNTTIYEVSTFFPEDTVRDTMRVKDFYTAR
jgi:NDP-sugar pyrophosphorylase family protein